MAKTRIVKHVYQQVNWRHLVIAFLDGLVIGIGLGRLF